MTGWKAGPTQVVAMIDHTDVGKTPWPETETAKYLSGARPRVRPDSHDVRGSSEQAGRKPAQITSVTVLHHDALLGVAFGATL